MENKMENKHTASLDYESEYNRLRKELDKAKYEICTLRDELALAKRERMWFEGMKQTMEVIFGRGFGDA
jgi:predicted  nucleic acid-binding Zn-ribbon protein